MANNEKRVQVVINLPNELRKCAGNKKTIILELKPSQFKNLTWLDCLRDHNFLALHKILAESRKNYTIMDRRGTPIRKVWKLSAKTNGYIDSFVRTLSKYTADIGTIKSNTDAPPRATPQQTNTGSSSTNRSSTVTNKKVSFANQNNTPNIQNPRQNGSPNTPTTRGSPSSVLKRKNTDATPGPSHAGKNIKIGQNSQEASIRVSTSPSSNQAQTRASGRNLSGSANPRPVNFRLDLNRDETASMAMSVNSQDSQLDELKQAGVVLEDIKGTVVQALIKHVNNSTMLNIRQELRKLISDGSYIQKTRHIPLTAMTLQLIFNLGADSQ